MKLSCSSSSRLRSEAELPLIFASSCLRSRREPSLPQCFVGGVRFCGPLQKLPSKSKARFALFFPCFFPRFFGGVLSFVVVVFLGGGRGCPARVNQGPLRCADHFAPNQAPRVLDPLLTFGPASQEHEHAGSLILRASVFCFDQFGGVLGASKAKPRGHLFFLGGREVTSFKDTCATQRKETLGPYGGIWKHVKNSQPTTIRHRHHEPAGPRPAKRDRSRGKKRTSWVQPWAARFQIPRSKWTT